MKSNPVACFFADCVVDVSDCQRIKYLWIFDKSFVGNNNFFEFEF